MISIPVNSANLMSPQALIIILVIVLIIFGPSRLPKLGSSLGKTMKAIREGADGEDEDDEPVQAKAKTKAKNKAVNDNDLLDDEE